MASRCLVIANMHKLYSLEIIDAISEAVEIGILPSIATVAFVRHIASATKVSFLYWRSTSSSTRSCCLKVVTMRILISYATQIRQLTSVSEETIELDVASTLQDALDRVCQLHGEDLHSRLFDSEGEIHGSLLVCVNDEQVISASSQPLEQGDEVLIMSAISGG